MGAKNLQNFHENIGKIYDFIFKKFQINLSKFCVSRNFEKAVSGPPYFPGCFGTNYAKLDLTQLCASLQPVKGKHPTNLLGSILAEMTGSIMKNPW